VYDSQHRAELYEVKMEFYEPERWGFVKQICRSRKEHVGLDRDMETRDNDMQIRKRDIDISGRVLYHISHQVISLHRNK
jgi:hypothetical protein